MKNKKIASIKTQMTALIGSEGPYKPSAYDATLKIGLGALNARVKSSSFVNAAKNVRYMHDLL
jgi:hypothetical protein